MNKKLLTTSLLGSIIFACASFAGSANNFSNIGFQKKLGIYPGSCTLSQDGIRHPRGYVNYYIAAEDIIVDGQTKNTYEWKNCYVLPDIKVGSYVNSNEISCPSTCSTQ